MVLNAGDLRWRITIEQLEAPEGVDPDQYPRENWTPLVTLYAQRLNPRAGDETWETGGAQIASTTTTVFRFWYRADMDADQINVPKTRRVMHRGSILQIIDARTLDWREGIEIVTRENVARPEVPA